MHLSRSHAAFDGLSRFLLPQEFRDRKDGDRFNLKEYCQTANIVLPAEKGKALMWYNYELDGHTGWMSHRDTTWGMCREERHEVHNQKLAFSTRE